MHFLSVKLTSIIQQQNSFLKSQCTSSLIKIKILALMVVLLFIKDDIPFIRRTNLKINELECVWLEINFPNTKSFLISVWYRPSSTSKSLPKNFNELLRNSLINVSSENKETILTGDINIYYQKVDDNVELKTILRFYS